MYQLHKFFLTKKEAKRKKEREERIEEDLKRLKKIEKDFMDKIKEEELEENRKIINKIYINMRYWLRLDGALKNWAKHYANVYTRLDRNEYLEDEANQPIIEQIINH